MYWRATGCLENWGYQSKCKTSFKMKRKTKSSIQRGHVTYENSNIDTSYSIWGSWLWMPKTLLCVFCFIFIVWRKGASASLFLAVSPSSCFSAVLALWHLIYQTGSRLSIKTLWSERTHCARHWVTARMEGDKKCVQSCHYLWLKDP